MAFFNTGKYTINLDNVLYYETTDIVDGDYIKKIQFNLFEQKNISVTFSSIESCEIFEKRLEEAIINNNEKLI